MGLPLHTKIVRLLAIRGLERKDLAAALGVAPQALEALLKGAAPPTLAQLKALIRFFGIRADYWLDDARAEPTAADACLPGPDRGLEELRRQGIVLPADRAAFQEKVRRFVLGHPAEWAAQFGALSREELAVLGQVAPEPDPDGGTPRP